MATTNRYAVNVYDCAGAYRATCGLDFAAALATYRAQRAQYAGQGKVIELVNEDRIDLGHADGLTEEEREAVDDA